ncbi:hypothetical protein CPC08DRAFT_624509 [Agrocybe pediades]|nr:hypothetical protein CPC08DRAFT_624509 [Agrocybe pediades]
MSSSPSVTNESTRQWSFTGFEWEIPDVHRLRDFVEGIESDGLPDGPHPVAGELEDFAVLKQSPTLGDHKFKLEIALVAPSHSSQAPTLCLYITSLILDFAQEEYEYPASMMAAIKCHADRVGERGARPDWVWEYWQNDWVFRRESEVWECALPPLSSLLQNSRIADTDSMVLCIQIHSPAGPDIPQRPSVYYVPRDLLDGLEASLDNSNTGDVRFVCLEKYPGKVDSPLLSPSRSGGSAMTDSTSSFGSHSLARKRIIYAHSDILTRRSEYFATMLSSSFSENSTVSNGGRQVYTIIVEEADFETMYWLLKYCYANWLLFKQNDDPRVAVEGVGAGWSARWLTGEQGEWDWKAFQRVGPSGSESIMDDRSTVSGESSALSASISRSSSRRSGETLPNVSSLTTSSAVTTHRTVVKQSTSQVTNNTRLPAGISQSRMDTTAGSTPSNISRSGKSAATPQKNLSPAQFSVPKPPHPSRKPNSQASDPHVHPTPAPGPASALSIYQVAHRYTMPKLAALAQEHIMSTITPQSSFALLLATSPWDELHSLIEDFVIERWEEVHVTAEFEHCLGEVSAGEWGPDGGNTLVSVFRRLRSPSSYKM